MNKKDEALEIANRNNGILLTKQITDAGIYRSALQELEAEGKIIRVQHGVYVTPDGYVDDFFLLQHRFPKGIYSHETALYLLGYSDRVPLKIVMTFPQGQSSTRMRKANIRPVMISKNYEIGKTIINRNGRALSVYTIERTLVDLLKPRYDSDMEQLIPALKRYANSTEKDVNRLFQYAKLFGVEKKMNDYMGVLL
ncbi:type IV toxin-antitoxin system AbiEi family antitoxin domain-containing protein [Enterococcus sp. DIV0756]|uniref:type IV toxin-antitoxin system AbiEi family antitoxin domain-containing protein n=1 Tax=Enterococcus sp. DIV0756 TaxID=2774636 RepID=UPI003F22A58F